MLIADLLARINTRHYGLTKNIKSVTTSQPPTAPGTPTFVLPIPAGADLPLGHLNAKEQQAMSKILAEWTKVEQIQQEKIKLAMRLEQITSRARERGRSEWKKVGGMDLDEIEKSEGPRNGFGEMGGAEVLLPPGGLGSGSDGRPMKSESTRLRSENIYGIWELMGRKKTERVTFTPPEPFNPYHAPSPCFHAPTACASTELIRSSNKLSTRSQYLHVDSVRRPRCGWRDGRRRGRRGG